jgi:hypothetical protein
MTIFSDDYCSSVPKDIREQVDKLLDKRNELKARGMSDEHADIKTCDALLKGYSKYYEQLSNR